MSISRRQFLLTLAGAAAVAAGVGVPVVLNQVEQIRLVPLPDAPAAPLSDTTRATMRAVAATTFVNYPVDLDRYEQYFVFRAENIAGYGQLYTDLSRELDRASNRAYRQPFAAGDDDARRRILEPWMRSPVSRQERLLDGFGRGLFSLQVSQRVFGEILTLFMNTDAWIAVGYEAWPGMPRGLENYLQPLPGVQTTPLA